MWADASRKCNDKDQQTLTSETDQPAAQPTQRSGAQWTEPPTSKGPKPTAQGKKWPTEPNGRSVLVRTWNVHLLCKVHCNSM